MSEGRSLVRDSLAMLAILVVVAGLGAQTPPTTFKLAYFNVQSGRGEPALPGFPSSFPDTSNCTDATKPLNAWGLGIVQRELATHIAGDPAVVAMGLGEAWPCASPSAVRAALGWAAASTERNGVAIVARYGFGGPELWKQLDTSLNLNPKDTMWLLRVPVCLDPACSRTVVVVTAHWLADSLVDASVDAEYEIQAQQTLDFLGGMAPGQPRALLGDLNVFQGTKMVCGQAPRNRPLAMLAEAGYLDAWSAVHGREDGYTGMWNRSHCGSPEGNLWKRIDYTWSKHLNPLSMTRFGMVLPGREAPSDHAGIITEFALPHITAASLPPDVTIVAPSEGSRVAGTVTVHVDAHDDQAVARVELLVNGGPLTIGTTAPYTFDWNTGAVGNGPHVLQAAATDWAGNRTLSAPRAVTVDQSATLPSGDEIVLYASSAAPVIGNWIVLTDATAAGGARLHNPNADLPKVPTPLALPGSYVEWTFTATAGKPYRLWLRGKAERDYWGNDSVFVQFDGAVDQALRPTYRIGTTEATTVVLEECSGCPLSNWGWQDNGYGLDALGAPITFAVTGPQRIRIQTREDGVSLDQIVLSAGTYFTRPPGAPRNDATILPAATPPPPPVIDEVVLRVTGAQPIAGNWVMVADATAAGGSRLHNPDAGVPKLTQALAAPLTYFDLSFDAEAGKPYRLWLRAKAQQDYYGNDSVFVQFDGSVTASQQPVYRIGTTLATTLVLEECSGCPLVGWGWQDNGYGANVLGEPIYFATSGRQRVRIQTREDGLSIDQVVLSAVRFFQQPPGSSRSDTTILPLVR